VSFELLLVPLESGRGVGVGKDVTLDQIFAVRTLLKTLLQAVCDLAALEFVLCCLEGSVRKDG
jgi:hypothetical protein